MNKPGDIVGTLSGGDRRSIGKAAQIVQQVLQEPGLLADIVEGIAHQDPVVRMRCADVAEKVSVKHPDWLCPFAGELVRIASECVQKEVRWHVAQMLPRVRLSARQRDKAIELLFCYLDDESKIVKVFAATALAELAANDRNLRNRLVPVLEGFIRNGSPAMKNRGKKLIALLTV